MKAMKIFSSQTSKFMLCLPLAILAAVLLRHAALAAPSVAVSAAPNPVAPNSSSDISWTSSGWNTPANVYCKSTIGGTARTTSGVSGGPFSTGNLVSTTTYTVNCFEPSGTMSATSCTIPEGSSTCDVSLTWTTADLTANPTEVTRNNPDNTHVSSAASGTNVANTIQYGASTFFLYHEGTVLAQSTVTATCASGTAWGGSSCQPSAVVTPPTVTQCSDGIDNDGDGKIDYPADPDCTSPSDNTEGSRTPGYQEQ